jgi:hypothetical protein
MTPGFRRNWIAVQIKNPAPANMNSKTKVATTFLCLVFFLAARVNADPLDNWQVQQLGTDILTGATYGNGLYVIVGQTNGKIWTSPDTVTWTDRSYDTTSKSYGITFADGVFAAAGVYPFSGHYDAGVQSSTDGISWSTTGVDPCVNTFFDIAYVNNEFFAMGGHGLLFSSDGVTWPNSCIGASAGPPDAEGVAYGNGMYVVVFRGANSATANLWAKSSPPAEGFGVPVCTSSPCPTSPFRNSGTTSDLLGVAFGNSRFVAVGAAGTIITSPDGTTWTSRTSGTTNTLYGITFASGVFATAGDGGTILTSPDGIAWTARASGTTNLLRGIAYTNNRFIAVGVDGTVTISGGAATNAGAVANISTRSFVDTGDNVMIGGIIVQGGNKKVIIRAVGPSLSAFGITNALADPTLELHDTTGLIASNDDWQTTIIGGIITTDQVAAIQNSGHAPSSPKESAIIATLSPGSYTAIVRGVNGTGVGLVEVFALP